MTIPSVVQGTIELEDGKVIELDSVRGATWLESIGSFRFEPVGESKPFTVRKESGKGGYYWYGYRKEVGKLHKRYIGKTADLTTAKLEDIAEALNVPSQPRVTDKVIEVTDTNTHEVTDKVTDTVTADRLTALELQVQALQESLEALRVALPGKSDAGDFEELPAVTGSELQIEVGNLKAENEALKISYKALLESSTAVTNNLRQDVQKLRSDLETERADREEIESELSDLKQNSAPIVIGVKFPEPAIILSHLRGKRKKSTVTLADIDAILGIIEES